MTDNQIQNLKDDIAFMKALAQEGQQTPLLGGAILVAAGLTFGLASVAHWALMTGQLSLGTRWAPLIIWGGALAVFFVALTVLRRRIGGKPGAGSPGNRAFGMAWASVGWTIFALSGAIAVIAYKTHSPIITAIFPSLILALYGGGWSVAAAMARKTWLWLTAIGSYVAAVVVAWFCTSPVIFLVYAAALMLLAVLPGFMLMRQEPSDTI
ncbi:hypothetical protein QO010_003554 [Caulobacter ginsengisoli]|uniref:DUF2157 domain-containing protein n=1 Tax=Caulobacter ginsengisoli TaxID=400775 RepID=A0ABU0IUS1_9CAUL|nr:hypothetical protein [Caulobacter ginsengisoli]MDQ0465762.1 hypothetical protein [Caulobacter ginsengisoli]